MFGLNVRNTICVAKEKKKRCSMTDVWVGWGGGSATAYSSSIIQMHFIGLLSPYVMLRLMSSTSAQRQVCPPWTAPFITADRL